MCKLYIAGVVDFKHIVNHKHWNMESRICPNISFHKSPQTFVHWLANITYFHIGLTLVIVSLYIFLLTPTTLFFIILITFCITKKVEKGYSYYFAISRQILL